MAAKQQNPLLVLGKISAILDSFSLRQPVMSLADIREATNPNTESRRSTKRRMAPTSLRMDPISPPKAMSRPTSIMMSPKPLVMVSMVLLMPSCVLSPRYREPRINPPRIGKYPERRSPW